MGAAPHLLALLPHQLPKRAVPEPAPEGAESPLGRRLRGQKWPPTRVLAPMGSSGRSGGLAAVCPPGRGQVACAWSRIMR